MTCARRPKALPRCHIQAFIPAHLRSQKLFHRIHASAFMRLIHAVLMQQHSRHTHAAGLTPQHLSCRAHTALTLEHSLPRILSQLSHHCICAAALTPQHFCRSIHAAACTEPHLYSRSHAPAFTPLHLCCSIHTAALFRSSHAAALMPSLS